LFFDTADRLAVDEEDRGRLLCTTIDAAGQRWVERRLFVAVARYRNRTCHYRSLSSMTGCRSSISRFGSTLWLGVVAAALSTVGDVSQHLMTRLDFLFVIALMVKQWCSMFDLMRSSPMTSQ
jgi:hypothetical protein